MRFALVVACLGLAACSVGPRWIAVADGPTKSLLLFDADLTHADTIPFSYPDGPFERSMHVSFSNGGHALLMGLQRRDGGAVLFRLRRADGQIIDEWPSGTAVPTHWTYLSRSRTIAAVGVGPTSGDSANGHVSLAVPDNNWAVRLVPVCSGTPRDIAPFNHGERIFVSCTFPGSIAEIDPARGRLVRTSFQGLTDCGPELLSFSRSGGILFVYCATGRLLYLDRVTLQPIDSADVGVGVDQLLVLPRRAEALLTLPASNELVMMNLRDKAVRARVATALSPRRTVLSGDGRTGYVLTQSRSGQTRASLLKIDLGRAQIISSAPAPRDASIGVWPTADSPQMDWR